MSAPKVHILSNGFSTLEKDEKSMRANCTCTFIEGPPHIIVDTMTAWDKHKIIKELAVLGFRPEDVSFAIATHGHADHVGNMNLFTSATHIVGQCVTQGELFPYHNFDKEPYRISEHVEVFATPGHTAEDVSVRVRTQDQGVVIIAGDLFEREEDLREPALWRGAGSQDPDRQQANRRRVLAEADRVVPGHGPMFVVTDEHRRLADDA